MTSKKNQLIRKLQGGLTDEEYFNAVYHTCPHCGRTDDIGYIEQTGYWKRICNGFYESLAKYRCASFNIWKGDPGGCGRVWYEEHATRRDPRLHLKMPSSWRGVPKV